MTSCKRWRQLFCSVVAAGVLSGCIMVGMTDTSGQAVTQIARGAVLRVPLALATQRGDLTGFEFRVSYEPSRFGDPTCTGKIPAHDFFAVSPPRQDGANRYVKIISFGLDLAVVSAGTAVASCDFAVKTDAPTGPATVATYQSLAATVPDAAGNVQQVPLEGHSSTVTIF